MLNALRLCIQHSTFNIQHSAFIIQHSSFIIQHFPVPLLTLDDVSLAFGHLPLFEHADLRIEPGERIALIGRNGSGKSSLLKLISGEAAPDSGTIWRTTGLRTARLEQDVLAYAVDRTNPADPAHGTVFDE